MKQQLNARISDATRDKLDALTAIYGTQAEVIAVAIDRLYQKEQGTMNDYRVFPAVIYRTPDGWGETTWADAGTMTNTVDDLKSAGDDYQNISLDDCDMFSALTERGAYATYRRMGVRYDEFWVIERNAIAGDGYYQPARVGSRVAQYSSLSDLYDDFPAA